MEDVGHQDEPNCLGCNYDGHSTQKQPPGNHQVVLLDVVSSGFLKANMGSAEFCFAFEAAEWVKIDAASEI